MSTGEHFDFKIGIIGQDERKPCNLRPLNLDKLLLWIDAQKVDEALKVELKKSASGYPHQALSAWRKNYVKHVMTAQEKLRSIPKPKMPIKELGEETDEKNSSKKDEFN